MYINQSFINGFLCIHYGQKWTSKFEGRIKRIHEKNKKSNETEVFFLTYFSNITVWTDDFPI